MKKNSLLLIGILLMFLNAAFAADVTLQDAQTVAVNFFKTKSGSNAPRNLAATLQYTRTETDNTVDFYVFNMSPSTGFVIVSATDNDQPVIGYSTESSFHNGFSRVGVNDILNRWSQELHYVKLNNVIATPKAAPLWSAYRQGLTPASEKSTTVGPLCTTTWSQENDYGSGPNLYNNYCPGGNTGDPSTSQAVTGCVATAMAQIMKYWAYPPVGIGSNSYDDNGVYPNFQVNYGVLSANFADSTFSWANMPATLSPTSTRTQIDAIGRLMSCAGISVDMDYDSTGSGAPVLTSEDGGTGKCAQISYVKNFGYQNVIEGIGLSGTTSGATINVATAAFEDSIEAELNAGRLVQMEGDDHVQGGHTWVLDGYETSPSVMFHMNWGWSGYSDGYFAVTNLDPSDGGTTNLDFATDVAVLTHILPPPTSTMSEYASVASSAVCAGVPTQLNATTHTGATYSWTPTTGLSSSTIANPVATPLTTTTYSVTADSAGVTASSTVTITVHPVPSATVSAANPSCFGSSNGSVTVTASGGTAGYTYSWNNSLSTATISNLAQGTYTVTVTDTHSCTASAAETLTQPQALSVSTTHVNATCGQANGSITTSVGGGTSGYTYHWSNNESTATATGLTGGTYDVTITDAHSCTIATSASITSSGTLSLVTSNTGVSCYGAANGTASATVTGNTGNVTYHWSNGGNTATIQNVTAATYTVTITDGSGCSATSSDVVSQPAVISPDVHTTNAGCGTPTGSATATATGGTGAYSYSWSTGATGSSVTNIPAGTYDVSVTDANHCSATAAAVVAPASSLTASVTSDNVTCFNESNGTGQITPNSGTSPYSYNWSNGATTATVINLTAGSYTVTVTDADHCTTSGSISVTQPTEIQFATSSNSATDNQENGSASVGTVSGGTPPYNYNWSNGSTTQSITNVSGGTYRITVTDANGCSQTATDVVSVKSSTGINNVAGDIAFSIYPNPASTQVMIQIEQSVAGSSTTLSLRNILGQTLVSQIISSPQTQVDLTSLADGVYLVELRQGEKAAVKQLVITK